MSLFAYARTHVSARCDIKEYSCLPVTLSLNVAISSSFALASVNVDLWVAESFLCSRASLVGDDYNSSGVSC